MIHYTAFGSLVKLLRVLLRRFVSFFGGLSENRVLIVRNGKSTLCLQNCRRELKNVQGLMLFFFLDCFFEEIAESILHLVK